MKHLTIALFLALGLALVFTSEASAQPQDSMKPQISVGPDQAFLILPKRKPVAFPVTTGTKDQLESLIDGRLPAARLYLVAILPRGEVLSLPTQPGEILPEGKRLLFRMTSLPKEAPELQIYIDPKKSPTELVISAKGWKFSSGIVLETESTMIDKVLKFPVGQKVWAVIVPMHQE